MQITPVSFSFMPSRYDTIGGIVLSYGKLSMPGLWNLLELLRMLSRLLLVIKRTYSQTFTTRLTKHLANKAIDPDRADLDRVSPLNHLDAFQEFSTETFETADLGK